MIKTVSFAPPRAASSRSNAKTASTPRSNGKKPASGSSAPISDQTALDFDAEPVSVETTTSVKSAPKMPKATPLAAPVAKITAAKSAEPEISAANSSAAKAPEAKVPEAKVPEAKAPVKARKPRVPKDLAAQYGENPTKRAEIAPLAEVETPKKRLTKIERQARRELIKPDEDLLARLARVSQIQVAKVKSEPRGKGWKFHCGRCGQTSYFETRGALCACGAIAIKE